MAKKIKNLYVIHHSHTDIGYTDLQERVIDIQKDYIGTVLSAMKNPEYQGFRWNCETLFCVEEFFKTATQDEKNQFYQLVKDGKMGLSANYLNFNDLLDAEIFFTRLEKWKNHFEKNGVSIKTAMFADINGISMGCRDAMIKNGVEFLYTNIHCHHGMYPLFQNQNAFWWENKEGKKLLVLNGEHYNLGNVLGIKANERDQKEGMSEADILNEKLKAYLESCESQGYPYDFIVSSVSGVFSDNAPPETKILDTINAYNEKYGEETNIKMVSLSELYDLVKDAYKDVPTYKGDFTDWWGNGVGSTPYAVKHYLEARRNYHLIERLDGDSKEKFAANMEIAEDNLLLYAEHTWGHSSTVNNPYDTMVLNLDSRKNSYASKAHEATSKVLLQIVKEKGDILRYYNTSGKIKVYGTSKRKEKQLIEFYIETLNMDAAEITNEDGVKIPCQVSEHPRGRKISFIDEIGYQEEKFYDFKRVAKEVETINTRQCYIGAEQIKDIINDYDTDYQLPYYFENDYFYLAYEVGKGITSFKNKKDNTEMIKDGTIPFFTPIYESTKVRESLHKVAPQSIERRIMGRNMRGKHSKVYIGDLEGVVCEENGDIFSVLRFKYKLEGASRAHVVVKIFNEIPRIDYKLELGKNSSPDVESVFLSLNINLEDREYYIKKGEEAFRTGIDQIPGTCIDFYMSDNGVAFIGNKNNVLVATYDTPLIYTGELKHHAIRLCQNKLEDNNRDIYSWIMNNIWETNFKMDLSGFCEFMYSLWIENKSDGENAMNLLEEKTFMPKVIIVE
ncbi:MAG: hypothetical protein ACK5LT_09500 [Lachnospirales bacterium]